jgi:two-component system, OmpR family, sensor kinase
MSLRLRLTFTYGFLLVVALTAFGVTGYVIASNRIYQGVDDTLSTRATLVTSTLKNLTAPLTAQDVEANRSELEEQASLDAVVQLRQTDGTVAYTSTGWNVTLPPDKSQPNDAHFMSRKVEKSRMRILYQPLTRDGQTLGMVEVGQSLKDTDSALDEIRNVFLAGGFAVCLAGIGLVYVLSGRSLAPVRQVSQLARDIERTADFTRRLPAKGSAGETKELIVTFNEMIERVETTLAGQLAFLADSSHELRRPLTVLRTNVDVLKEPGLSAEDREACLAEMRSEAESMSRLLSDLLLLSRDNKQAIARGEVDYSALCEEAAARLRAQDGGRHEIESEIAPEVHIVGDRERLAQMLWNLLENAMNYTPAGGRIALRLGQADGIARVDVADSGIGIQAKDVPHVFERFYRGDAARSMRSEGSGLGLAIARYVAEAHGGEVRVSGNVGGGTVIVAEVRA